MGTVDKCSLIIGNVFCKQLLSKFSKAWCEPRVLLAQETYYVERKRQKVPQNLEKNQGGILPELANSVTSQKICFVPMVGD